MYPEIENLRIGDEVGVPTSNRTHMQLHTIIKINMWQDKYGMAKGVITLANGTKWSLPANHPYKEPNSDEYLVEKHIAHAFNAGKKSRYKKINTLNDLRHRLNGMESLIRRCDGPAIVKNLEHIMDWINKEPLFNKKKDNGN